MIIGPMFFRETINYILIPFIMELTEIEETLLNAGQCDALYTKFLDCTTGNPCSTVGNSHCDDLDQYI